MITRDQLIQWLETSAAVMEERKVYLTELDAAIGDADHGTNMARGFKQVVEKISRDGNIADLLKSTGMILISTVGGASGPLYGTFFMRAAAAVQDRDTLNGDDLLALLQAGVDGLIQRGRAEPGDKTMIDAWNPALAALKASLENGDTLLAAVDTCVQGAANGVQATIPLQAKKGRASYLGERSIGHQDPGATSTYYLLNALLDTLKAS